jgi:ABC-type glycerol-3-phosphate transport system substrate-binding protein
VTFDASSTVWPFKRDGKLDVVCSRLSTTRRCSLLTGGIFKGAPHPNAAKLYLTWLLAKEQQAKTGSFSVRDDVDPPAGFQPITSYKVANAYREFVTDAALIADLRNRFEAYTGPPVNKGGVR